jgi:hypothetical protein
MAWVLFFGAATCPTATAGNITYNLVNYPQYQNANSTGDQWSLSGTIVTDGALGAISSTDILSASITISDGTTSYSGSADTSSSPSIQSLVEVYGLIASPAALTLPVNLNLNNLFSIAFLGTIEQVLWGSPSYSNPPLPVSYYTYEGYGEIQQALWTAVNPVLGGTDSWIIATAATTTVPEPSSVVLGVISLASVGGLVVRRRIKPITARRA